MSEEKDTARELMIEQGYVIDECKLPGMLIWASVNEGKNICIGCNVTQCSNNKKFNMSEDELEAQRQQQQEREADRDAKPSRLGRLRFMGIEDKSSGTGLIQKIKKDNEMWVKPIPRNIDKITRAHDGVPYMFMGKVLLPSPDNVQWMDGFLSECRKFNGEKTHLHDDQIDPMLDAIDETFGKPEGLLVG